MSRFPSPRQFFSSCRLVPGADTSAGRTRHRSGSKAGSRYLTLAFSHAGIRAVQYSPGDPGLRHGQGAHEAHPDRSHPGRARAGAHRLSRPGHAGGLQRAVQEPPRPSHQTAEVATPGKPIRLTDSREGGTRLIGKPGVVPTRHLGPSRCGDDDRRTTAASR
ncbi:MAG: transposase [Candidatus Rokuibacteriota bacterium]